MKRILKISGWGLLVLFILLFVSGYLLTKEKYQNILARKATEYLSGKLKTEVSIEKVKIDFFNNVHLQGVLVRDEEKDTLAYVGNLEGVTNSLWSSYWNGTKMVIRNFHLKDVLVRLKRPGDTSRWNYAFIVDAFSSDKKKDETKQADIEIDVQKVYLKNIRFYMSDAWGGQEYAFKTDDLNLDFDEVDLKKKKIGVNKLYVDGLDFLYKDYPGGKPRIKKIEDKSAWGTAFNNLGAVFLLKNLEIRNTRFHYNKNDEKTRKGQFNENNIHVNDILVHAENIRLKGDTLYGNIRSLKAIESCGLEIRDLVADVKVNQQIAELQNMKLQTAHSDLKGYYSMKYKNFHDFEDFIEAVYMKADLETSRVSNKDIGYFANIINEYPILVQLSGQVEGKVNDLIATDLSLRNGASGFHGNARVTGLPDADITIFDIDANTLNTSGKEINRLIPQTRVDDVDWETLENIVYKGTFKGTYEKFNINGLMHSSQGIADVDILMDLSQKQPTYDGVIKTQSLNIGRILKRSEFGKVTMTGKAKGSGFSLEDMNLNLYADITALEAMNDSYKDLKLNGTLANKKFDGVVHSTDPNLNFDFNGLIDFASENPSYNFKSKLVNVNLKRFGLSPEDLFLSAVADIDFKGKTVDDFIGYANLRNAVLRSSDKILKIDTFHLSSSRTAQGKVIALNSNLANGILQGNFSFESLDKSVRQYLHYYMPQYISKPYNVPREDFDFDIYVKELNPLLAFYKKELSVQYGTHIKGGIHADRQRLDLEGEIPGFRYENYGLQNVQLNARGDYSELQLDMTAESFLMNQSEMIHSIDLTGTMAKDTAHLRLTTQASNDYFGSSALECRATSIGSALYVDLLPSSVYLKEDKWLLESEAPIIISEKNILSDAIRIENGTQAIVLHAINEMAGNNLKVNFKNIDLERISYYLGKEDLAVLGRLDGNMQMKDLWNAKDISGEIFSNTPIRIQDDTLGLAKVFFNYDLKEQKLKLQENSSLNHHSSLATFRGEIDFDDEIIDMNASMDKTPVSVLNQFMAGVVSDLTGNVSGQVFVKGRTDAPKVNGGLTLNDLALKLDFSQVRYHADKIGMHFDDEVILFEPFRIYDHRENPGFANVTGKVSHKGFQDFRLKFHAESDNILGLNTDEFTGDMFYGTISSRVNLDVRGTIDDIQMDVVAKPLKGSQFVLPLSSSVESGSYDFVKYVDIGHYQNEQKISNNYFRIHMEVEATPNIETVIIMDPNTGEQIRALGSGNLVIDVDMGNFIEMRNTYTIDTGTYLFNYRGLLKRDLGILKGGTIAWNGDPLDAQINLSANYVLNTSLAPLVKTELQNGFGASASAYTKYRTNVFINLDGPLSKPNITFDITQPDNNDIGSLAYSRLQEVRNDKDEKTYQAGMLLLFNSFKPMQGGISVQSMLGSTASSTAGDVLSDALSPVLNNVFNKITGLDNISLNVNYSNNPTAFSNNQQTFDFGLSGSFFKDRVLVDFGNSLDVVNNNNTNTQGDNRNFAYYGDFKAQYLVTPDGRLRINAFTLSQPDPVSNKPVPKAGLGLSYKKVFDRFSDLWISRKKRLRLTLSTDAISDSSHVQQHLSKDTLPDYSFLGSIGWF